jgi:L-ascorbate metabolism protein UlaG (beta-lactamase superfamily)
MQLTKFEHSCVLVEESGTRILIDPGTFSRGFEDLRDLNAVLITHQHADHVDVERLGQLLQRNTQAALYADDDTVTKLANDGITAQAVHTGDILPLDVEVVVHGVNHAVIHPDIPVIPNVGYLIAGRFFHPGDALTVPEPPVDILALPTGAPWLKAAEAIDYLRNVAPRIAIPIHEAVLARPAMHYALFERLALDGTTVQVVDPGTTISLP